VAPDGLAPPVLRSSLGFVGTRWIEGERLRQEDAGPEIIAHLSRYICRSAKPGLANGESRRSIEQLARMLRCNAEEALDKGFHPEVDRLQAAAEKFGTNWGYGDGRLAPHEWVRTDSGEVFKTDHDGHSCDHTIVGEQSFLWDVAGAIEEWELKGPRLKSFLNSFAGTHLKVEVRALHFYRCAYAAFWMGMFRLSAEQAMHDEEERERLVRAEKRFQRKLKRLIKVPLD